MANNSTPDVYLLLGVEGGSNIGKGSGLLISTQLKQIMEQVEETITSHLKIKLDQNSLNDLKTQINSTVTEVLTSIKGTPVELTFSFDQKSIDAAFSKVKKEMKEQQLVFSSQTKEKKETGKSGTPASTGNVSKEAAEVKQETKETEKSEREIEKTTQKISETTSKIADETKEALDAERQITSEKNKQREIVESQNTMTDEQRLAIEKQITLEKERQAFYESKTTDNYISRTHNTKTPTESATNRYNELVQMYSRSKRINVFDSKDADDDFDEKIAQKLNISGYEKGLGYPEIEDYKAEHKMIGIISDKLSGVTEATATVYANSLKSALNQVAKDLKWKWAQDIVDDFAEYGTKDYIVDDALPGTRLTSPPYNHFSFNTTAESDDIYEEVFKKKEEWSITAVEFTEEAENYYQALEDITNQLNPLQERLEHYRAFISKNKEKFGGKGGSSSLFDTYEQENRAAARDGAFIQLDDGRTVLAAPNTFARHSEMWSQYRNELLDYANYLDEYRNYIFDYAGQVQNDAIKALQETGDNTAYQETFDKHKEHLESLANDYASAWHSYYDAINNGSFKPDQFPLAKQFQEMDTQAKSSLDSVEKELDDVTKAEEKAAEAGEKLRTSLSQKKEALEHSGVGSILTNRIIDNSDSSIDSFVPRATKMFSPEQVSLLSEAVELIDDASAFGSLLRVLKEADEEGKDLNDTIELIKESIKSLNIQNYETHQGMSLDDIYKSFPIDGNVSQAQSLDVIKQYANSRIRKSTDDFKKETKGLYKSTAEDLTNWLNDKGIDIYGQKLNGVLNTVEDIKAALQEVSKVQDEALVSINGDSLSLDISKIKEFVEESQTVLSLAQDIYTDTQNPELQQKSEAINNIFQQMQDSASTSLNTIEKEVEDVVEAEQELKDVQDQLEIKIPTLPGEDPVTSFARLSDAYDEFQNKMQGLSEVSVDNITEGTINSVDNLIDKIDEETKVLQDNTDTTNENAEAQAKLAKERQKAADAKAKADAKKAQKAADQEEKALRKVEEVIARTDTRLTALNNNLNNLQSSRYNANELTGSFEAQIFEIDQLIKGIKTYISLSTDERQSFDWAEYGAENVTTLSEALGELNSKLVITEASMKKTKIDTGFLTNESITTAINQFNQALRAFKNTQGAESYKDLFNLELIDPEDITKSRAAIQTIIKDTERLTTTTRSLNEENRRAENIIIQRNKIYQEADNYYKKYQSGIKANITLNKQWLDLIEKIKAGGFGDNNEAARKAFAELQTATKAANAEVMTLWGSLKKLFTDHFGSVSATAFIGTLRNIAREAYQNVLAIDKAMTELRKVTDETEKQYERFMNTAADLAIKVGGTIADTISSTADFARLGFNLDQSTALAEAAMVYKNVGDGLDDINEASESIISTIKAFSDVDAKDAMSIIDKFNEVGNNYAISSAGIGTALQKSAAALASANNSLDESIALITAGNSVVQNPEIIGTTMKTISMFLRASKTEAEEAGIETEGMAESVSKLREEIKALSGIDIMFDEENYKSTYQILKEISEVWENISDVSQANILEKLGGKRNANVVASVIENFDVAEQSLQTSLDAAGSAMQENEKYLNSIEGHINKLTVAYEDLSKTVIESDLLKTGIDFLTSLTSGLNGIMDVFGALPTAIATATAAASAFKNVGIFRKEDVDNIWKLLKSGDFKGLFNGGFNGLKERLGKNLLPGDANDKLNSLIQKFKDLNKTGNIAETELKNITDRAYELGGSPLAGVFSDWAREGEKAKVSIDGCYKAIINGNTKGLTNISSIIKTFNGIGDKDKRLSFANQVFETNEQLGTYLKNIKDGKAATSEYIGMQIQATAKTVALTVATAALNAAISIGTSLIIQGIVTGLDNMIHALDNAIDKTQSAQDSIKESEDKITSINDELKTTETRLKELSNIETPTLFEQDEINRLKEYNKELRRSLNLEQRKLDQERKKANDESRNAWNTIFGGVDTALSGNEFSFGWNYAQGKTVKQNQDALERYRRLLVQIEEEEKKYLEKGIVETETSRLATMRREAEALESQLNDFVSTISIIRNGLDPEREENKWIITLIDNFIATYDTLNELPEGKTFTDIWNSADYAHITNDLKKLAAQGKLTEETFSHVAGINQFTDALAKIGIYNVSDIIATIIQWVEDSGNAAEVASLQLSDYAKQLEGIKDILDSKSSMRSNIQSAFDKIMSGESLTDDDILKFKEYPEIFSQIEKTTDGWTISVDTLSKAYSNLGSELRDAINGARNNILSARDTQVAQFNENKSAPKINSAEDYQKYIAKQDELTNAIQDSDAALSAFDVLLDLYSDTLRYTAKETDNYNDVLKEFSSNISTGVSAQKEMDESGTLSASTVSSLLSLGEEYIDVLYIENGQIKLNVEAYQDLTKAKLADEEATLRLAKAEIERAFPSEYMAYGKLTEQTQKLYDDINTKLSILESQGENIDDIWNKALSGSGSDTTDSDYSKALNKLKRANTGTIEAEKEFIAQWKKLNEETYKNTDLEKYEENLREIEDYIKGLTNLLDDYLSKWDKVNSYDENNPQSREIRLTEMRRVNYEIYGDKNSDFYNLDTYEKNLTEQAKFEAETQKQLYDRGLVSYDRFMAGIQKIRQTYRDRNGSYLLDQSFVSGYEDIDKVYSDRLDRLKKANDKSIEAEQEYVEKWKATNEKIYKGVDNNKFRSNRQEIANYELSILDRMYKDGLITAKEYFDKVTDLWNKNSDILGKDTQYEWLKEAWDKRTADEKLYWEQQKELATQYYDEELEKLRDIQDEEELINKAEELRLNLIKARQKLEEAKSQKNQLIFHDGTFEYMADQEAIMSAEEEVANALKEIKDNELQEQIKVLEDQRDEALLFYSNIIGMLDYYINGTRQIESSDPEVVEKAMASESGNYFMRLMLGEITPDEVRDELRKQFTKDETATITADSTVTDSHDKADTRSDSTINEIAKVGGEVAGIVNSFTGFVDNMKSLDIGGLFNLVTSLMGKVSKDDTIGFVGTSTSEAISNAINNVYNNSNVSNDNSVNVGDIHMTIQGGTSQEMLDQFASKLSTAIITAAPRALAN